MCLVGLINLGICWVKPAWRTPNQCFDAAAMSADGIHGAGRRCMKWSFEVQRKKKKKRISSFFSGKKKAHKHNFFCPVGLGTTPGLSQGFHRTNPVKTWDTPGFSSYFSHWKPDFTGLVPGTNPVCFWGNPGDEGRHCSVYVKIIYVPLSLASFLGRGEKAPAPCFNFTKETASFTKGRFRPYEGPKMAYEGQFLWQNRQGGVLQ